MFMNTVFFSLMFRYQKKSPRQHLPPNLSKKKHPQLIHQQQHRPPAPHIRPLRHQGRTTLKAPHTTQHLQLNQEHHQKKIFLRHPQQYVVPLLPWLQYQKTSRSPSLLTKLPERTLQNLPAPQCLQTLWNLLWEKRVKKVIGNRQHLGIVQLMIYCKLQGCRNCVKLKGNNRLRRLIGLTPPWEERAPHWNSVVPLLT